MIRFKSFIVQLDEGKRSGGQSKDNDPKAKVRPEQGLLKMRSNLGLFANVRPIMSYPSLYEKSPLKNDTFECFLYFRFYTF